MNVFPDSMAKFYPSSKLIRNPHKGFTDFQRFRGDSLNENWTPETGYIMELIPDGVESGSLRLENSTSMPWEYPDTSIAYFRIPWRKLEPSQSEYDFTFLDKVLAEANRRGQKVMLRFPPNSARPIKETELPDWLIDELKLPVREVGNKMSPDHPLFYDSYSNFLRAVGQHIDGDSRVSSVDMALISAWGEQHQIDMVSEQNRNKLVDGFMQGFKTTPISAIFNSFEAVSYANTYRPVGFRADCLGDMKMGHMAQFYPRAFPHFNKLWEKAPIAFEVCWVMEHWLDNGWDIDFTIEQSLLWHISTFNEKSARIPECLREKCENWIKKMGYRFALRVIDFAGCARPGDTMHFAVYLQNLGVAPIYHKYPFIIRLRHESGAHFDFETDADITSWLPGDNSWEGSITLPQNIPAGNYSLELGIYYKDKNSETVVRFACEAQECDGFTVVGSITIE